MVFGPGVMDIMTTRLGNIIKKRERERERFLCKFIVVLIINKRVRQLDFQAVQYGMMNEYSSETAKHL